MLYNFVAKHISCSIVLVQGAVLNFENYYILKLTTHENTGIHVLSAFWQQKRNAYWIYECRFSFIKMLEFFCSWHKLSVWIYVVIFSLFKSYSQPTLYQSFRYVFFIEWGSF